MKKLMNFAVLIFIYGFTLAQNQNLPSPVPSALGTNQKPDTSTALPSSSAPGTGINSGIGQDQIIIPTPIDPAEASKLAPYKNKLLAVKLLNDPDGYNYRYDNVWIFSQNFGVPGIRTNFYKSDGNGSKAAVGLFNSLSVGVMFNRGSVYSKSNKPGSFLKADKFDNKWGFGAGILLAYDGKNNSGDVLAPVLSFNFLDAQIYVGYDFGNVQSNISPIFAGITYNISFSNIFSAGTDVVLNENPYNAVGDAKLKSSNYFIQ